MDGGTRWSLGCCRLFFNSGEVDASTMIPGLGSHQGNLVVPTAKQSQDSVQLTPDGRVPLPALRRLLALRFLGFGLKRFVLLLRHFHHRVLGLLQLGPLLGRTLSSPAHLHPLDSSDSSSSVI